MRRLTVLCIVVTAALLSGAAAWAQPSQPAEKPPADARAFSINLEDLPYPHPVKHLPFTLYGQDVRMAYMDVPPASTPNGRTVVLLHGMNFFGEYWKDTIEVLRKDGFRVIVPDQIGFGRSSKPIIPYTLHDMALNTKRILDALNITQVQVVGHSMGGVLGTRFAFSYPKLVTHLVIVNQIGLEDARLQRPWRPTDEIYKANLARGWDEAIGTMRRYFVKWKPEYEKYARVHYGWTLSGEWPRMAMIRAHLSQMIYTEPTLYDRPHIKAKTLVLSGAEDGPSFRKNAKEVADAIPGAQLILFDGVGHNPQMEAPEKFFPELVKFLKSASGPSTSAP